MALINCGECNHEVSDKAEACLKCGAPISTEETVASGAQVIKTMIEKTSKMLKIIILIKVFLYGCSTFLLTVAVLWGFAIFGRHL